MVAVPSPLTAPHPPAKPKPFYRTLYFQVLVAVALGILTGHFYPQLGADLKPLGDAFIKLVKMIIAPVIFLTVVSGIAGMTNLEKVGRVGGKALIYFITFSTLALIVGLIVANVLQPGNGLHIDPKSLDPKTIATYAGKAKEQSIVEFLMKHHPHDGGRRLRGRARSFRCCSSRSCSASGWPSWASAASRCSTSSRCCRKPSSASSTSS